MVKTLDEMIVTISLQAQDGETKVEEDVFAGRQELYKNIGTPQLLLDILSTTDSQGNPIDFPENLCKKIFCFLMQEIQTYSTMRSIN